MLDLTSFQYMNFLVEYIGVFKCNLKYITYLNNKIHRNDCIHIWYKINIAIEYTFTIYVVLNKFNHANTHSLYIYVYNNGKKFNISELHNLKFTGFLDNVFRMKWEFRDHTFELEKDLTNYIYNNENTSIIC